MSKFKFLQPFLLSLYPVLFLYGQNINYFRENALIIPILLSLAFSGSVVIICQFITKKWDISAVISSLLILFFFSYSRIKELFKNTQFKVNGILPQEKPLYIVSDAILFIIIIIVLIIFIVLIYKHKSYLRKINKALSILSLSLFALAFFNIASLEIKTGRAFLLGFGEELVNFQQPQSKENNPDIYYFILDRYAGNNTLKDYGFDNSPFISYLEGKGFYIASGSTSNYPKTFLSLGSTLNMDYLNYLTVKTRGGGTSDESFVTPLVQNNKIVQFLKNKGYTYVHVGSGWDPTRSNKNADLSFILNGGRYPFTDEFTSGFLQTTLASPILKYLYPDTTAVSSNPKNNDSRSRILYEFETFDRIPDIPGPKFVFTHILVPHDPYVLGKNCEPLDEETVAARKEIENYLNQLQCANKKMEVVLEQIFSKSAQKPIIILQADEGPFPIKNPIPSNFAWKNASDLSLKEKFPILNAFLLPGINKNPLYPSITPVNSFRVIFNTYFETNLPLLPDQNFVFEDADNVYKFIDVTEKVKQ